MSDLTVPVDGVTYTFSRLEARIYEEFARWVSTQLPDPVDELLAVADRLPEAMREKFLESRIDAACDRKRLRGSLNDPDFQTYAGTIPALKRLFYLLLRKHHPALSEDQAFDVFLKAQELHGEAVFEPVFQSMRSPVKEEDVESSFFRGPGADRADGKGGLK